MCLIAIIVLIIGLTCSHTSAAERPHVLVIAIDDLRDYLGCYGRDFVKSPNIDALAGKGVLFQHAYCQMAVCGPSRSSFISGMRPDQLQAFNNKTHFRDHHAEIVSLPQHFKNHGYQTAGIGKVLHNTHRDPPSWTEPFVYPLDPQYAASENISKRALIDGIHAANRVNPLVEAADVGDTGYRDGLITQHACRAIKRLAKSPSPMLVMVGFHKPHSPFNAPKRYWDLYDRDTIPLAPNPFPPENSPRFSSAPVNYLRSFAEIPATGDFPEPLARQITHGYLACVSYIDAQVGKLMRCLQETGLAGNTIVVLWSDHGYQLGHHNLWCKHSNFEAATRVPLIMVDPRSEDRPGRFLPPVELLDLFPTVCDLAQLPIPPQCQGRSLAGAVRGDESLAGIESIARSQFNKRGNRGRSIRTLRYRLTQWRNNQTGKIVYELFDHELDPQENTNVAGDTKYADVLKSLIAKVTASW